MIILITILTLVGWGIPHLVALKLQSEGKTKQSLLYEALAVLITLIGITWLLCL